MITFVDASKFKRGFFFEAIKESYGDLISSGSENWKGEIDKWRQLDTTIFNNPDTIGKCVFVTKEDGIPVGFASYNPITGEVGQNCVLPKYRGRGLGRLQIKKVLEILKEKGLKKVIVTTSEHPFFSPAQKVYRSLGFKEVARREGGPEPKYKLIDYKKIL